MSEPAGLSRYRRLMVAARDPLDIATLALGGVMARFRIQGLDAAALTRLYGRYFPGSSVCETGTVWSARGDAEFEDLLALLRDHRRDDNEETEWVARAVASACAGENHLWEDMGLPDRATLSQLIRRYFTTLYYKNSDNLKWKKFFYKQLCHRAEVSLCKAPSCSLCSDFVQCFDPDC